jgi:hypothetical protein
MQCWDGLRLELLALGYRRILYFELSCADHGDFRSAYEPDGEFHPACPRCGRPAEAAILAEGFTRRASIPWELVSGPLAKGLKGDWRPEPLPKRKAPDWHKPRSGRPPRRQAEQARSQIGRGVTSSIGNLAAAHFGVNEC